MRKEFEFENVYRFKDGNFEFYFNANRNKLESLVGKTISFEGKDYKVEYKKMALVASDMSSIRKLGELGLINNKMLDYVE